MKLNLVIKQLKVIKPTHSLRHIQYYLYKVELHYEIYIFKSNIWITEDDWVNEDESASPISQSVLWSLTHDSEVKGTDPL